MEGHRPGHGRSNGEESEVKWTFGLFSIFALVWVLVMFGSGLMHHGLGPGDFTEANTFSATGSAIEEQEIPYNSYLWTE